MKLAVTFPKELKMISFIWTPHTRRERPHYHDSLEIGVCLRGKGQFYYANKCYEASQGDVFVVNHRELHIAVSDQRDPSTYLFLKWDPRILLKENELLLLPFTYSSVHFCNHIPAHEKAAQLLSLLMQQLHQELHEQQEGYESAAKGYLLQICVSLLRHVSEGSDQNDRGGQAQAFTRIKGMLAYLEQHYREPIALQDLAEQYHISSSRISHDFKEVTGKNFKDYVMHLRIEHAKAKLVATNEAVTEICFDAGFQSIPSFYRAFAMHVHLSPIEYRNQFAGFAICDN
ncbi:hypothetical protein ASG89_05160 [Paenibacillus sp. Soil766]|uniref:AraC family transcriptional regulator n=1 Tax=Paenibacillus sp. Soil766 TaxID=1736404 RepID=UPI00070C78E1|nr:AraC family transcriptional regulator [Paenibacillus sp. Soil766]KRE98402.1 hypothetical protein ASG89_05160 [Paenibacillus sp. Soil766]